MKTVLVTGGAGFIGSNFVHHILGARDDVRVVVLDKLTYAGNLGNFAAMPDGHRERFRFVKGDVADVADVEAVFAEHEPQWVVNFAAETHVDRSIHDPKVFLVTNVLGTQTLLDACAARWRRGAEWRPGVRFLQVSTDEVYGSLGPTGLFTETTPLDPRSPYSASKAGADFLVSAYHNTFGLPGVITRCSNNYGPYQFPEKLIPLMILNALQHRPLPVYGDGRQVRDWLHVEDHCAAIARVLEAGRPGAIYNVGGDNERENIWIVGRLIEAVAGATGDPEVNEGLIRHVEDRPGHDRRYAIDATLIRTELGWAPTVGFEQGLAATVRWYLENRDWTARVVSGEYRTFYEKNYAYRLT
jgi:dTDP-glucose 4,6-dehydratase